MKVTLACFGPTEAALEAGQPVMSPEMLSAIMARYSRNDTGIDEILNLVDGKSSDSAIDSIFKMVDYGHASIADMASIPIFIDKISIWLAYYIFSICPQQGGQETSTRYVKFDESGILSPELAGIPEDKVDEWKSFIAESISHYNEATTFWQEMVRINPDLARIPKDLIKTFAEGGTDSHKAGLTIGRLQRNYAFDRARYFIPAAALTNLGLVMSARSWVELVKTLASHYIPEANLLSELLKDQLKLVIPRLMKHCSASLDHIKGHHADLEEDMSVYLPFLESSNPIIKTSVDSYDYSDDVLESFTFHDNRYARIGRAAKRLHVNFSIYGISMAELRDLNRHRTGYKYSPAKPAGFYCAEDQLPEESRIENMQKLQDRMQFGVSAYKKHFSVLMEEGNNYSHPYWGLLGTKYYYQRGTYLDKLAYEIALRTGPGVHWRYSEHMKEVHDQLIKIIPKLEGKILVGSSEPE